MAINNVYNQTPKRIFTNKPFVNGMVYTNADLAANVCRAVANLDMEASNTATKVRQSLHNNAITPDNAHNIAFKFYNKLVIFDSYISEDLYNENLFIKMPNNDNVLSENQLGVTVRTETSDNPEAIFSNIIYNDASLEFIAGNLSISNSNRAFTAIHKDTHIYPLKLDSGVYPHTINGNDYSFSFFGIITTGETIVYKGLIKLYYHVAAQQVIIEVISPYRVDPVDVNNYGANIISNNPLIYKDYLYYSNGESNYLDYSGGQEGLNIIDISTVQIYDAKVNPSLYDPDSSANIIKGVSKNQSKDIYVRPYVALPKGNYYATVSTKVSQLEQTVDAYYNFNTKSFVTGIITEAGELYEGNSLSFEYAFSNTAEQNGSLSNIAGSIYRQLTYADNPEITEGSSIKVSVPSFTVRSTPVNENVLVKNQAETVSTLINTGHGNPGTNNFGELNRLISTLEVMINPQTIDIAIDDISSQPDNPTMLPIAFRATEETQVYLSREGEPDDKIGIVENNIVLHSTYESLDTPYETITKSIVIGGMSNLVQGITVEFQLTNTQDYPDTWGEYDYTVTYQGNTAVVEYTIKADYLNEDEQGGIVPAYVDVIVKGPKHTGVLYQHSKNITEDVSAYFAVYKYNGGIYGYPVVSANLDRFYGGVNQQHISYPISFFSTLFNNTENTSVTKEIIAPFKWDSLLGYVKDYWAQSYGGQIITRSYNIDISGFTHTLNNAKGNINKDYTKTIQSVQGDAVTHELSLPLDTLAFNNSLFESVPAVVLTVTIFSGIERSNSVYFENIDKISMASAPLQINLDSLSILTYDELQLEYNLKDRANNIAMHLGHYILYNSTSEDNSLFYSYYNDPSYFPSMYTITLDNPVVYVHPHQSSLVVFTTNDIYLIYNGNVPSTVITDGAEIAFTVKLIQSNIRLGEHNYNTVRSIGKDVFFITDTGDGYLLKTNKYVSDASDTYLIKITTSIDSLLNDPYAYVEERLLDYGKIPTKEAYILNTPNTQNIDLPTEVDSSYVINEYDAASTIINIVDGDTLDLGNTRYRLAGINTPEYGNTVERLGELAKQRLQGIMHSAIVNSSHITVYIPKDNTGNLVTTYGRQVAYLYVDNVLVNAELLRAGLAKMAFDDYSSGLKIANAPDVNLTNVTLHKYMVAVSAIAKYYNMGVHNSLNYTGLGSPTIFNYYHQAESHVDTKYVYATNSYIYIVDSIIASSCDRLTIMFKYNIDNRTWTTYDVKGALFPIDHSSDHSRTGFKLYCSNSFNNKYSKSSIVTFNQGFYDYTNIGLDNYNNIAYLTECESYPINVYFDSGNQSLALMNDKLFREIKLSLGTSPDNLLGINYGIRLYVDGKEVQPNTHYKGKIECEAGFKKITFFTPARGRIPRITFHIDCESDLNILQYAIVYLQLNAK